MNAKDMEGVLRPGHYAGLKFENGWLFIQALQTEFIELKPWILLNENENRAEIAATTAGSEDDEIQDTLDRRYIMPDDSEENLIFQLRMGIAPSRMQIYPFFGRDRSPNLEANAEPGEPQVPVTGYDSPYNNPSEQAEVFTISDQEFPSFQAYNPMDTAEEARVSFHVNKIKYAVVEDVSLMKAMLQGSHPVHIHEMGLGAQKRDQLTTPSWLSDKFGSEIHTTQEILSHQENGSGDGQQQGEGVRFPRRTES